MGILSDVISVVKDAGEAVLEYYNCGGGKKNIKPDGSPVTKADLVSQKIILQGLKKFGYPIISEEQEDDDRRLSYDKAWLVDPLDGTKDFLNRTGEFSVMVGLVENGEPILGVVYQPVKGILYYARKGFGAYKCVGNAVPVKLKVSSKSNTQQASMFISRNHTLPAELKLAKDLGITKIIPCGSAGIKVGLIASGEGEIYVVSSGNTSEWDTCAPDIIIHEAGGFMTDMKGEKLVYNKKSFKNKNGLVVTNWVLHEATISALKKIQ